MPAFRVSDLAKRWQCSPKTVRTMIRGGELSPLPFTGRLIRISEEEVLRWEQSGSRGPKTAAQEQKPMSKADFELAVGMGRLVTKQRQLR